MKLKKDSYSNKRGGNSKVIDVFCSKCNATVLTYQKDGIGNLHRCYLNRIIGPDSLAVLYREVFDVGSLGNLMCRGCGTLIGTPMKYDDGRLAFRLVHGAWHKKLHKP